MVKYLFITLFLVGSVSFGQGENLTPEQEKLSFIKGKWTVDGAELTYVEGCDFIQGNHLQCIANSTEDPADNSRSYFSYSALEKVYIYYGLYGSGNTRMLKGQWLDDHFLFEGERQTADKFTRWRVTMKPNNGNIDFMEERSVDHGEWKVSAQFQYEPAPGQ